MSYVLPQTDYYQKWVGRKAYCYEGVIVVHTGIVKKVFIKKGKRIFKIMCYDGITRNLRDVYVPCV